MNEIYSPNGTCFESTVSGIIKAFSKCIKIYLLKAYLCFHFYLNKTFLNFFYYLNEIKDMVYFCNF